MPAPLLIAGGIAAAAAAGAGIAKVASGVGRNTQGSTSFERTQGYDPNAARFGGYQGGLQNYTQNMEARRQAVDDRGAYQANYALAEGQRQNALNQRENALLARGGQQQAAGLMMGRATGAAPSIAGMQAQEDMRRLQQGAQQQARSVQAAQGAQAASARGAAGVALAGQTAANNTANAQAAIGRSSADAAQGISNQAQVNAANERLEAERAAAGAYGQMRQGDTQGQTVDLNAQQQDAGQAQFQAGLQQQNRVQNDQRAMGYEGLSNKAASDELNAQTQNQATLARSLDNSETLNQQRRQENEKNKLGVIDSIFGGKSDARAKDPLPANALAEGGKGSGGNDSGDMASKLMQGAQIYSAFASDTAAKAQAKGWGTQEWMEKDPAGFERASVAARGRREPESFHRDTSADQGRVREDYYAGLGREADAMQAGYKNSLAQGPSVARDEGDVDAQPGWLSNYMDGQGKADPYKPSGAPDQATAQWERSFGDSGKAKQDVLDSDNRAEAEKIRAGFAADDAKDEGGGWQNAIGQMLLAQGGGGFKSDTAAKERAFQAGAETALKFSAKRPEEEPYDPGYTAPTPEGGLPPPRPPAPEATRKPASFDNANDEAVYDYARTMQGTGKGKGGSYDAESMIKAGGPVAAANRAMEGQPYAYKPEHTPPNEKPGQPHYGFMAQNLLKSPVTATAVEKGPDGMLRVDRDRMLQAVAAGVSDLQKQQDDTRLMLAPGGNRSSGTTGRNMPSPKRKR